MRRISSGIKGFDKLTQGGFPEKSAHLLRGPTGSAKTLFGLQFIQGGLKNNEKGLFLSVEESRENMKRAIESFDLSWKPYESRKAYLIDYGELRRGDPEDLMIGFKEIQEFLDNFLSGTDVTRLVLDSISAISLYYSSPEKLRRNLFEFCRFLKEKDLVTLLITESDRSRLGVEGFVTDSVINLGYEDFEGEFRRSVKISKMRFTKHDPYKHPFLILDGGIEISVEEILR
ncbi:MAG: ATPase domain-containing protein [Candidatus Saliniplasma sp.]